MYWDTKIVCAIVAQGIHAFALVQVECTPKNRHRESKLHGPESKSSSQAVCWCDPLMSAFRQLFEPQSLLFVELIAVVSRIAVFSRRPFVSLRYTDCHGNNFSGAKKSPIASHLLRPFKSSSTLCYWRAGQSSQQKQHLRFLRFHRCPFFRSGLVSTGQLFDCIESAVNLLKPFLADIIDRLPHINLLL